MPTAGRLTWTEKLDAIQARMNEAFVAVDPQLNIPYFDRTEIERILLEVSNANLKELSIEDISAVGKDAIDEYTNAVSPIAINIKSIDVVSATYDGKPMVEVTPAAFFQNDYAGITTSAMFSVFGGNIYFVDTGASAVFQVLAYQSLADWQATPDLLPPAYDEKVIRETCEILELADYVPVERI